MGRKYGVPFDNVSVSAIQDAFEVSPAANKPLKILGFTIGQTGNSDVGDAAEEILAFHLVRGHTTSGSGGSSVTPVPLNPNDAAAGFTAEVNNTTIASAGTTTTIHTQTFNVRLGLDYMYPPGYEPIVHNGNTSLVGRLVRAPADAITLSGTLLVEEM
jgi:hypothetical protein